MHGRTSNDIGLGGSHQASFVTCTGLAARMSAAWLSAWGWHSCAQAPWGICSEKAGPQDFAALETVHERGQSAAWRDHQAIPHTGTQWPCKHGILLGSHIFCFKRAVCACHPGHILQVLTSNLYKAHNYQHHLAKPFLL